MLAIIRHQEIPVPSPLRLLSVSETVPDAVAFAERVAAPALVNPVIGAPAGMPVPTTGEATSFARKLFAPALPGAVMFGDPLVVVTVVTVVTVRERS
ncbi:hypothetical protein EEB13_07445 [Rhodococcus sp. WS3]|nr:hypothetical protein EEB13_07445 [Rhodococcus sp. WS3]